MDEVLLGQAENQSHWVSVKERGTVRCLELQLRSDSLETVDEKSLSASVKIAKAFISPVVSAGGFINQPADLKVVRRVSVHWDDDFLVVNQHFDDQLLLSWSREAFV